MKLRWFLTVSALGLTACTAFAQVRLPQLNATSSEAPPTGGIATGEIVWQQPQNSAEAFASQDFGPDYDAFDIQFFADIETDRAWVLGTTFALALNGLGPPQGNGLFTTDVVAQIWDGLPWEGGTMVAESIPEAGRDNSGTNEGYVITDFGGATLPAGNYYYSIFIHRPYATGGQVFLYGLQPAMGANDLHYNPGGGFALCNGVWCEVRSRGNGQLYDVNFTLIGKPDSGGCEPCDTNCDGTVDAFDIEPFIGILTGVIPNPCSPCAGDADDNGVVDAFDIEPFITCLTGP